MSDSIVPSMPVSHRDRRGALLFFGILQIALGALALLVFALTVVSVFASRLIGPSATSAMPPRLMIPGLLQYALIATILIVLGVGSILCRRWARAVTLAASWDALVAGILVSTMMIVVSDRIVAAMPHADRSMQALVLGFTVAFIVGFGIVLPAVFVLFYRSLHVAETCRVRDPHPRWTDTIPLPLLALSLWLGYGGLATLGAASYGVVPLGHKFVTGFPAVAFFVILGALFLFIAFQLARRRPSGWWLALAATVAGGIFGTWSMLTTDFERAQDLMGYHAPLGSPDISSIYTSPGVIVPMTVMWIALVGFLLYVRRYFRPDARAGENARQ